jgi:uncharacterized protein GlcG (DUF336 family)
MIKTVVLAVAALAAAGAVQAQGLPPGAPGGPPLPPPRARGPAVALAVEAAQVAVATCLANGYKVTALVVDSGGVPVAMLVGDGAAARTLDIAPTKIAVVLKYKVASGVIADRVKTDAALAAEVKADPKIGTVRQGALPLMVGPDMIGAFAVSGAPGGDKDEVCVKAGLDRIAARLK